MINKAKQGLVDVFRHNDTIMRTQEIKEDLQRQEEAWREDKRIGKSQEEAEEQKKKSEMELV